MMSKEEILLNLVLDKFSKIKKILNDTEEIKKCLSDSKANKISKPRDVLEKSRILVDRLFTCSSDLKNQFKAQYKQINESLVNNKDSSEKDESEKSCLNGSDDSENKDAEEKEVDGLTEKSSMNGSDDSENKVVEENEVDGSISKANSNQEKVSAAENQTTKDIHSDDTLPLPEDEDHSPDDTLPLTDGTLPLTDVTPIIHENILLLPDEVSLKDTIPSSEILAEGDGNESQNSSGETADGKEKESYTEVSQNSPAEVSQNNSSEVITPSLDDSLPKEILSPEADESELPVDPPKSLIRLVDLSKLIDPKPKKSVKFDSSVIILTSSDEETESTLRKKNTSPDPPSVLRSALKNSPLPSKENKTKESPRKQKRDNSDSDSRGSKKSKHKRNKSGVDSSDESDADEEPGSTRKKSSQKEKLGSVQKIESHHSKHKNCSESEKENSESNDNTNSVSSDQDDTNSRKSTRLKKREKQKIKTKANLRKIFKRTSRASSFEIVGKESKKPRKIKDVIEVLSDTSSLSDVESLPKLCVKLTKSMIKKEKSKGEKSMDTEKDEKFGRKVYVPLPLIECEKLKEVFLRNKEILEIRSLAKLDTLKRRSKRSHKDESKSSSDAEKPATKKSKTKKTEQNKDSDKAENSSSDDEHLSGGDDPLPTDGASSEAKLEQDKNNFLAEIALEKLKATHDGKSADETSNESSDEGDKKTKKKNNGKTKESVEDENTKSKKKDKSKSQIDEEESEGKTNNKSDSKDEKSKDSDEESDKAETKIDGENSDSSDASDKSKSKKGKHKTKMDGEISDSSDASDKSKTNITNIKTKMDGEISDSSDASDKSKTKKGKHKTKMDGENSDSSNASDKSKTKKGKHKTKIDGENSDSSDASGKSKTKKEKHKKSSSDDSSDEVNKKNKKWKNDELLTKKIDSSDSDEAFSKFCSKKDKSREVLVSDEEIKPSINIKSKAKKKIKKTIVLSDSDDSDSAKKKKKGSSSSEESESKSEKSNSDNSSDEEDKKKKPKLKRIKKVKESSSSDEDKSTRKQIRRVLDRASLSETTKKAEAEEKERKARIAEKQKKYNNIFEEKKDLTIEKLVLDHDEKTKSDLLEVHKKIVKKLKPHQANGIQFMWDACFESVERTKKEKGSGCILAHCMGLGKTLQVVALAHTLLTNPKKTNVNKVLVVCPLNTVLNWKAEFKKWVPSKSSLELYELVTCKKNYEKEYVVKEWHQDGGVLIISYAMFRNLSNPENKKISKKIRTSFQEGLVDPGPDLVVCDEGHLLKNEKTHLSIAMNRIKTARRIVLTGTPLQNNLKEYWCMVQFIKPNLLGTYKEYLNRFVNPITNGQYTDSTPRDTVLMRKRSHVLHKLLDGVVQRRDYAVLEPYLPPKHEYVLFVTLTKTQVSLYKHYMERYARQSDGSNRTSFLFTDFQKLQRICTHPRVLGDKGSMKEKDDLDDEDSEGSLRDFIDDGDEASSSGSTSVSSGSNSDGSGSGTDNKKKKSKKQQKVRVTRAQAASRKENNEDSDPEIVIEKKEWWQEYCDGEELDNIANSGKLFLLFEILKECEEIGDKILIFSQSLYTLNCIEYFLEKIDEATHNGTPEKVGGHKGSWSLGLDYFRLDGSSSCDNRHTWCDVFNNPDNIRARLFLISTRAGGLGINLVAANRVIIFDVSWNPSHDVQSIYRVYRFGQTKPCYIYRFVTYGTMEMKIYERQVTKQAISKRVIDEQQIDRHYNQNDLQELYKCDLEPEVRPLPMVPKDVLLGEMLQKHENTLFKYHLHQSLLENKEDEGLNEEERKAAWEEFENEKVMRKYTYNTGVMPHMNQGMVSAQAIAAALGNIVRRDNPTWSEIQIKGIIPALVQQLQVQLAENDTSMYGRVLQEIQLMQAQKMREAYYQNQMMKLIQQQQKQQNVLGNLSVNPAHMAQFIGNVNNSFTGTPNVGGMNFAKPSSSRSMTRPNDVIELND